MPELFSTKRSLQTHGEMIGPDGVVEAKCMVTVAPRVAETC